VSTGPQFRVQAGVQRLLLRPGDCGIASSKMPHCLPVVNAGQRHCGRKLQKPTRHSVCIDHLLPDRFCTWKVPAIVIKHVRPIQ
jgi:hypothetical protein